MSLRGLAYFEQHFLLSNRLLQFLIRIRPEQSTNGQFFLFCAVIVSVSPMILHQFYQLFASDFNLHSAIRVLETMVPGLFVVYCYFSVYFGLLTVKLLYVHFKLDYEVLSNEEELNIMKKWKIRRPFKNDKRHVENDRSDTTLQEEWDWMIDIIKCYTRITELMFQLSVVLQSASETIKCCIYMAGSISTIYISYYVGQLLIDHSNDAFMELCQIPFYTLSIKTQKLLLLLLIRSIKPSEISIGGIFVASHEVFATLIQKAFSFATVYYINARHFTMLPIGLSYYKRHFLFSNRLLQFFLGLNSRDQFFMLCAIIGYLLPLIVHQFYQLYTTDKQLQPTIKVLESLIPGLYIIYCYITVYFSLTTIKLLLAHIKFDYEFVRNEMELNIMKKYTNKILLYLYLISITFPSILSVFLYIFGTSGSIHLTLPFSIDNVLQAGCNIPFYNFSVQTQKLLLLLLIRSIKPTELSIGGMFVVSHEVFAGIVHKAYSFAAIYYNTIKT
uniref:Odorant receptor n=1 Tax=Vespula pensylvanica TaxID=30213 RepID=A0A834KR74_VESPE|nr:hypothetical protein H0235_013647 [Vespula pensylvanica]